MDIVIKTNDRVELFYKKTWTCIIKYYDFDESKVHLFVSSPEDEEAYSKKYPNCKVVLSPSGIPNVDNFIVDYFPEGHKYIYMNDDVSAVYEVIDIKTKKKVGDLKKLLNELVEVCEVNNYTYGGFYPVLNNMFMSKQKEEITYDLCLIMDPLSVCINNKDVKITPIYFDKPDGTAFCGCASDEEKCIQHFRSRGGLVRYNKIGIVVQYYGKKGGYQGRDAYTEKYCAETIRDLYPEYIKGIKYKGWKTSLALKRLKNTHIQ